MEEKAEKKIAGCIQELQKELLTTLEKVDTINCDLDRVANREPPGEGSGQEGKPSKEPSNITETLEFIVEISANLRREVAYLRERTCSLF